MITNRPTFLALAIACGVAIGCESRTAEQTGATAEETATADTAAPVDMESARAAIQASADAWEAGAVAGDVDALMVLHTDDAILMGPGTPPARGADEIRTAYEGMLSEIDFEEVSIDIERLEVAQSGEMAWAVGTSSATVALPDGGTAETQDRFAVTFENVDGEWLVAADVWNTVEAPPAE